MTESGPSPTRSGDGAVRASLANPRLRRGALAGAGAYGAAAVGTLPLLLQLGADPLEAVEFAFLGHHVVAGFGVMAWVDPPTFWDAELYLTVLGINLVVLVVLLAAGFILGRLVGDPGATRLDAATAGASVVVGYLPLVALGLALLVATRESAASSLDLHLVAAAVLGVGTVVPVASGAIGGYLGATHAGAAPSAVSLTGRPVADVPFGLPLARGAGAGAAAVALGYANTYVLVSLDGGVDPGGFENSVVLVGRLFLATHFVPVGRSVDGRTVDAGNPILEWGLQVPEFAYFAVPVLLLFVTGYVVADSIRDGETTVGDGTAAGATVVAGYLPLVAVAVLLAGGEYAVPEGTTAGAAGPGVGAMGPGVGASGPGMETVGVAPDLGAAILLAGIAYPLLFGAAGGYLASVDDDAGRSDAAV